MTDADARRLARELGSVLLRFAGEPLHEPSTAVWRLPWVVPALHDLLDYLRALEGAEGTPHALD